MMSFRLGVEDVEPNHWVAFVFDHPGCFSPGKTEEEAVANAPERINEYFAWLARHERTIGTREPIQAQVTEAFCSFVVEGDYIVNALFEDDCRPLTADEVEDALEILDYSRRDLGTLVQGIPAGKLKQPIESGAQNSIEKILDHIAWAEWWYLDRVNLALDRREMQSDVILKLDKVRAHTRAQLPRLVGNAQVVEKTRERWTARKILRRTVWHERDHTAHIAQLIEGA